jgi:predicted ATPase/DNA-binding winged helix-turn-helix (wHTH) protein
MSLAYSFGSVEVRVAQRQVLVDGQPAAVGGRAFDVLLTLIERRDRLVAKGDLIDAVWPGRVVEPNNLAVQLNALRKALGSEMIVTIPGRGYRFVAPEVHSGADGASDPVESPRVPRDTPPPVLQTNLPQPLTPLIGRADDAAEVEALLQRGRLVNIVGAGGIGKTRLAQQVLHQLADAHPHGVAWADLSGVSDPALLVDALTQALGIDAGGGDPLQRLVRTLKPMNVLLGVDNAEHVLEEVARVVHAVLEGARGVKVLVTSRATLKLAEEQVMRLQPLQVPLQVLPPAQARRFSAVELFDQRVRAVDSRFALNEGNVAAVIDVCRDLDGLPLAIELTAAWAPLLGVARLAASLGERLRLLSFPARRGAPARQQTLRATLQWSHDLLGTREQSVLRRLAVFAGGFTLEMAQLVVANEDIDAWGVLDALAELVDHSLVEVDAKEPPRYRLLESTRAFALERLQAAAEEHASRARHAQVVLAHFERAHNDKWSGRVRADDAFDVLAPDIDNAREALAWSLAHDPHIAVALLAPMMEALRRRGLTEAMHIVEATAPHVNQDLSPSCRANWHLHAGKCWSVRKPEWTRSLVSTAAEVYRSLGDPIGTYRALCQVVSHPTRFGDEQRSALEEMRSLEQPSWPPVVLSDGAHAQAFAYRNRGDHAAALREFRRSLAFAERAGNSSARFVNLANMADLELMAGRVDDAIQHGTELALGLKQARNLETLPMALGNLTGAWLDKGNAAKAREVAEEGWPMSLQLGDHDLWPDNLALLAALEGRAKSAALCLGYGDADCSSRGAIREPNEARAAQRAEALAREQLGDAEFDRLRLDGAGLRPEDLDGLALQRPA